MASLTTTHEKKKKIIFDISTQNTSIRYKASQVNQYLAYVVVDE